MSNTIQTLEALRAESAAAADLITTHACDLLLGNESAIPYAVSWEERYGGGGHDQDEQSAVIGMDLRAAALVVDSVLRSAAAVAGE